MARSNKKKLADLPARSDPSAELNSTTFLRAAQPVLKQLEGDLIARAKASPTVTEALKTRHTAQVASKRTAYGFAQWQQNFIDQVAAAWLLSCVFVRTLEDRNLLNHPRIAGPGASDSQKLFFQMAPSLTERDYLLTVFRELTHFDAARDLFDAKHNPVWLLAPSAAAAKALLALFRTPSSDTPAFRFGQPDTRFLGDLYQDLNERVRKRYALLQTPRFVESFILDRTLERAIDRFGVDDATVIDPTCGSGHFLLGSFDRLYEHRLRAEPGLEQRQAAHKALDAVFGADINPYAVGIARFRLTLSFLEKAGFKKLSDAPQIPLHLVVADSLLHNPHLPQIAFADLENQSIKAWKGQEFALEDEKAARDVLHRNYSAVVGNPPYITVKDKALRDRYRELYPNSAAGKYSLAAPFAERFFQLGRSAAYVGMITANSFMKREFGKKLIEKYLPTINLDIIINTSGAYIPGHGTPTVLLFGTTEEPQGTDVLAVLASRGEPSTPDDPEQGHVWRSITDHWSDEGFENDYITVTRVERESLSQHPWALGGGGATELKALLEQQSDKTLEELATSVGISCVTGEDEVYLLPAHVARRLKVGRTKPLVTGEHVRDWSLASAGECVFPYDDDYCVLSEEALDRELRYLWPFKNVINRRKRFGTPMVEKGLTWYELQELYSNKLRTPLTITFAFVSTHNHFVLDRGGKVFKQSAPIIKLPKDATEDDHLALLAYLNSSTACFWMKQVMMNKGATSDRGVLQADEDKFRFEFDGTKMKTCPLPAGDLPPVATDIARELSEKAQDVDIEAYALVLTDEQERDPVGAWRTIEKRASSNRMRCVALQEELDWLVYDAWGLLSRENQCLMSAERLSTAAYNSNERPFVSDASSPNPVLEARRRELATNPQVALIENSKFKRRWYTSQGKFNAEAVTQKTLQQEALQRWLLDMVERHVQTSLDILTWKQIAPNVSAALDRIEGLWKDSEMPQPWGINTAHGLAAESAVPYLAAYRHTEPGLEKRQSWEDAWELQRDEDRGEPVVEIPVPPKYAQRDFQESAYWRLRGKLDVPKERFISYPGCEADEGAEPLYGWAGWNRFQRMRALAEVYQRRKAEGWRADKGANADDEIDDRLIPILAGLLELLPWVKQWHNEPSEEYSVRPGDSFQNFIKSQCREFGLTPDDLRNWRPTKKTTRRRAARGAA